jgi:hypothetical protein
MTPPLPESFISITTYSSFRGCAIVRLATLPKLKTPTDANIPNATFRRYLPAGKPDSPYAAKKDVHDVENESSALTIYKPKSQDIIA